MQRIVVLNPKGGSGKSTITTNLASYFAARDMKPTVMDLDPQGSSMRWVSKRDPGLPTVYGIAGFERKAGVTRSFALRIPADSQYVIIDTPAALDPQRLPEVTRDANTILVPVLPSDIDIHAATRCIADLLLIAKIKREEQRVAVIANRVKRNTVMYRALMKFLNTLQIPVIATLRDSQAYVRCFEQGVGIFEAKPNSVREDIEHWHSLLGWLTQRDSFSLPALAPDSGIPPLLQRSMTASTVAAMNPLATTPTSSVAPQTVTIEAEASVAAPVVQSAPAVQPVASQQGMSLDKLYSLSSKGGIGAQRTESTNKERS
ncbi:MAG: ParA family protein, partial [Steroidobacter sp.]